MFHKELMVTAFDVKYGKPNPEPYLMALKKGGLKADEAVVVENAPLGVEAGHKAGIFHNRCEHGTSGRTGIAGLRSRFITTVHASAL